MEEKKSSQVEALDVSKIIKIEDMIIKPNHVLIEIKSLSKSGLLLPDNVRNNILSRYEIIKVGDNVASFKTGYVVVDLMLSGAEYLYTDKSKGDRKFILIDSYNVLIAVTPENYDQAI
jgi:hypothetical protein